MKGRRGARWVVVRRAVAGAVAAALATVIGLGIGESRTTAAALLYIVAVAGATTLFGLAAGLAASVSSFVGLNYFFTPPVRTLSVSKTDDLIALVVFVTLGALISTLIATEGAQRERAERREQETRSLYALSSRLLGGDPLEEVAAELARIVRRLFALRGCEVSIWESPGVPPVRAVDGEIAPGGPVEVMLRSGDRDLGVLRLGPGARELGEAERQVAAILARQVAAAIDRSGLEAQAREARLTAEANQVRGALLSAVSHDLRTPLASIKASITAIVGEPGSRLEPAQREELLSTALEEALRLERLVTNLLDLTRIRSGSLAPERVPTPVEDMIDGAIAGLRFALRDHRIEINARPDLPAVAVDPVQIAQVFRNVLENAAKHAPRGSEIRLTAVPWHGAVEVRVEDHGPGIAPEDRQRVFEEFFRGGDRSTAGTGLGLAVARAIVEAHGGKIWMEETPGGGSTAVIRLPCSEAA